MRYNTEDTTTIQEYARRNQSRLSSVNFLENRSSKIGSKIRQRSRSKPFFGAVGMGKRVLSVAIVFLWFCKPILVMQIVYSLKVCGIICYQDAAISQGNRGNQDV